MVAERISGMIKVLTALIIILNIAVVGCTTDVETTKNQGDNASNKKNTPVTVDDMRHSYLSEKDADTKMAMSVVNKHLRANKKEWQTQTAYPRFRVGNMAFIEIRAVPTVDVRDIDIPNEYVVVVLGDDPQLFNTPSKDLFAQYAGSVRADPDIMTLNQRIRTALILATGDGSYIDDEGYEPSWTDKDGVLEINYYRHIGSRMMIQQKAEFSLIVDEKQNYTNIRV